MAERVSEPSAPAIATHEGREEVIGVVAGAGTFEERVQRLDMSGTELLPHEHRSGHVDICRILALQILGQLVCEVVVVVDQSHVNPVP